MSGKTILNDVKLCLKSERLKTFVDWPNDPEWFCTPEKLASAGFCFNPSDDCLDNVCCAFCCKELDGWEPDDDPLSEHKRHSSKCPFLKLKKQFEDQSLEECCKFLNKTHIFLSDLLFKKCIDKFKGAASVSREKVVDFFEERYTGCQQSES